MHVYDPNGAIRAYRQERNRREMRRSILFGVGWICGLLTLISSALIVLSVVQK